MKSIIPFTIFFFLFSCHSSRVIPKDDDDIVDHLFSRYDVPNPGASVLVIKNGRKILEKNYGYANVGEKTKTTSETNYRIASVGKQFTAFAIAKLADRGKLDYETSLKAIFPEFPDYGKNIKIRHLITHRSGLVSYNNFIEANRERQILDDEVFQALLKTDSTIFEPDTRFKYSNTAYVVLGKIVEKISGKPFEEFIADEIFKPLKMENSIVYVPNAEIKNRAFGYSIKNDSIIIPKDQSLTSAIQADGGYYVSISDYYKWDQMLYSDRLISGKQLDNIFSAYTENGKSSGEGYCFGWNKIRINGYDVYEHGGLTSGFGAEVIRVPDLKTSVIIFSNRPKGSILTDIAWKLTEIYTDGKIVKK